MIAAAGISVECVPANVHEIEAAGRPRETAIENATQKAFALARRYPEALVLGADTIVVLDGTIFGKPVDLAHAFEMLERLSGRVHEVITGIYLAHRNRNVALRFADVSRVKFRTLDRASIEAYLASIDPLDKAGAYAAQEDNGRIIDCVEGSFTNVVGLPMERLKVALATHFPEVLGLPER